MKHILKYHGYVTRGQTVEFDTITQGCRTAGECVDALVKSFKESTTPGEDQWESKYRSFTAFMNHRMKILVRDAVIE